MLDKSQERLLACLKTLTTLNSQIEMIVQANVVLQINKQELAGLRFNGYYSMVNFVDAVCSVMLNYLLIQSCSYLDEYNQSFTPTHHPNYVERIKTVKGHLKPVLSRINKWTDLKEFRNNVLAHNLRMGSKPLFSMSEAKYYNKPHTDREIMLLAELLKIISQNIGEAFAEEVKLIDFNDTLNNRMKFKKPEIDVFGELAQINSEVIKLKSSLNVRE